MPMIHTRVSVVLSPEKELALKTRFGKAIALLPGKSENWLMLHFEDQCRMYFRGDAAKPLAFLEVKVFGKIMPAASEALTAELTTILHEELAIAPDHIYIKYEECADWGWNGNNF